MPLTQINLNEKETAAINKYRKPRKWTKQNAAKWLVKAGLIKAGLLAPTKTEKNMGIEK